LDPGSVSEIARSSTGTIPVGPVIGVLISFIAGLLVYVRHLISQNAASAEFFQAKINENQAKLNDVYEARVQESRGVLSAMRSYEQALAKLMEVMTSRNTMQDRMILVIEKTATAIDTMALQSKQYVLEINSGIKENREVSGGIQRLMKELLECCGKVRGKVDSLENGK
jgi:methyl-accepting chemotaxis protein